jgi:hypothetical protein
MINISVQTDISRALSKLAYIREDVADKAVVRALNKTADQVKVQASREIRAAGYNLKAAVIKKSISLDRANRSQVRAIVRASGTPIGLINYAARQTKGGVTVSVKNGRKLIRGAFIARMPNGHTGVYERVGNSHKKVMHGGKVQWRGLPIHELFGPSIPSAFMNKTVQGALDTAVREKFPRLLKHEIDFLRLK